MLGETLDAAPPSAWPGPDSRQATGLYAPEVNRRSAAPGGLDFTRRRQKSAATAKAVASYMLTPRAGPPAPAD